MASNSSAAFFGVRDGDQQDQIKPLISPQQQQLAAALPGVASGQGAPSAAAQPPPPKKKRTMPGNSRNSPLLTPVVHAHCVQVCCLPEISLARLDRLEFYELDACSKSIYLLSHSHMPALGFSFHFFVVSCLSIVVLGL